MYLILIVAYFPNRLELFLSQGCDPLFYTGKRFSDYPTQYVDQLNIKFIKMKPERRLANISIIVKRLGELDHHYMEARKAVRIAARDSNVHESQIRFTVDYPEDFEW